MTSSIKKVSLISKRSKLLLLLSAILLTISIFVPIWEIQLDAPQYPEGLALLIYAKGLGGNVDIINGLNHYIGMKTLHNDDFIEFTLLPYLISFFALMNVIVLLINRKKYLYFLFSGFVLFGIVAMIDFWRWEYNYGHHLDPNAAIIVPGMAYQPPLIGFKQLLNFGAYSIPAVGGWMFIGSGALLLLALMIEGKIFHSKKTMNVVVILFFTLITISCGNKGPEPIRLNKDNCDYCKMTISNIQFASELITAKGRCYKFDDVVCLVNYSKENSTSSKGRYYINDFLAPNNMINVDSLYYVFSEELSTPMGGGIAAFSNSDSASNYLISLNGQPKNWEQISK